MGNLPITTPYPPMEALLVEKIPQGDGEIVIPVGKELFFDDLPQRIHPAESRVRKLAKEFPARLIDFDLLADEKGRPLTGEPLSTRRAKLEQFASRHFAKNPAILLSPATTDAAVAKRWLADVGLTLDGIVAKRLDLPYQSGNRTGMQKIKLMRQEFTFQEDFPSEDRRSARNRDQRCKVSTHVRWRVPPDERRERGHPLHRFQPEAV